MHEDDQREQDYYRQLQEEQNRFYAAQEEQHWQEFQHEYELNECGFDRIAMGM